MLLGNRPRPPMRRTTSSTEFPAGVLWDVETPQLPDPEGSIGGQAIDPHLGVAQGEIAGVGMDWLAVRFVGSMLSPRGGVQRRELFGSPETAAFLRACGLCNRRLGPGRDAFMYRGEIAFCSLECRQQHINLDEQKERCPSNSTASVSEK
ncbi:FCS-Like Zinc finger 7-like [Curcuma longa]|uniref:FCS-Like Zinc finger 7-like n=1 Tax=Curcuma longa TaxID=136217 RepID=UPI003D9EB33B